MTQPTLLIILAVLGVVGTLSGVLLGGWLTRYNEGRKWRREHALEAYSSYVRLIDVIMDEASSAYRAEGDDYIKHYQIMSDKLTELSGSTDRIILLSTNDVHAPFGELGVFVGEVAQQLTRRPRLPESEVAVAKTRLAELRVSFLMNARNDLGVHPRYQEWNRMPKRRPTFKP